MSYLQAVKDSLKKEKDAVNFIKKADDNILRLEDELNELGTQMEQAYERFVISQDEKAKAQFEKTRSVYNEKSSELITARSLKLKLSDTHKDAVERVKRENLKLQWQKVSELLDEAAEKSKKVDEHLRIASEAYKQVRDLCTEAHSMAPQTDGSPLPSSPLGPLTLIHQFKVLLFKNGHSWIGSQLSPSVLDSSATGVEKIGSFRTLIDNGKKWLLKLAPDDLKVGE